MINFKGNIKKTKIVGEKRRERERETERGLPCLKPKCFWFSRYYGNQNRYYEIYPNVEMCFFVEYNLLYIFQVHSREMINER